jgi:hypothetical protein
VDELPVRIDDQCGSRPASAALSGTALINKIYLVDWKWKINARTGATVELHRDN